MAACPAYVSDAFTRLVPLVRPMSRRLGIDEDFLLTLSVHEHGWSDAHNDALHNLFGTTLHGGNNLSYASDEASAASWEARYGGGVRGSKSIEDFTAKLRAMGYNSADPGYDQKVITTYKTVVRLKSSCGVK